MNDRSDDISFSSAIPSEKRVYSVTEITREIQATLEEGFPALWVEGEISNFKKHSSGHFYFSLKDADAQISCVMWRGRNQNLLFQPQDGMKVLVFCDLTVYAPHGRYQLDVIKLQPAGVGELALAFEALKRRLAGEGLFDDQHKRPIPVFPERIAVVTSPTGAAIRDILSVLSRRFAALEVILAPVRVQGAGAAEEIASAIRDLNAFGHPDVIIVGRGGGSMEDLWAFNEEIVARAIYESDIPVISAVGHEVDYSISDFVADMRAPTPSAAAELAVRSREELAESLTRGRERMKNAVIMQLEAYRTAIAQFRKSHGFRRPPDRIREYQQRMDDASRQLETVFSHHLENVGSRLDRYRERLLALNPAAVLKRGYSITDKLDGHVVTRSSQVQVHEKVRIRFHQGEVLSVIEAVRD